MKLENYGYKERTQKIRKMSMAEMRIGVMQILMKKNYRFVKIKVVNTTAGDVDVHNNLDDFIMAEYNESYEINLISIKEVDIYNEETKVIEKTMVVLIEETE